MCSVIIQSESGAGEQSTITPKETVVIIIMDQSPRVDYLPETGIEASQDRGVVRD